MKQCEHKSCLAAAESVPDFTCNYKPASAPPWCSDEHIRLTHKKDAQFKTGRRQNPTLRGSHASVTPRDPPKPRQMCTSTKKKLVEPKSCLHQKRYFLAVRSVCVKRNVSFSYLRSILFLFPICANANLYYHV